MSDFPSAIIPLSLTETATIIIIIINIVVQLLLLISRNHVSCVHLLEIIRTIESEFNLIGVVHSQDTHRE